MYVCMYVCMYIFAIFDANYEVKNKRKVFDTTYGTSTNNFLYVELGMIPL